MNVLEVILATGGVAAAVAGVTTLAVRLYRTVKRIDTAISTDDEGRTAVARLEDTVTEIDRRIQRVEYQLHPNGGGSLADKVTQVDRQVVELRAQTDIVLSMLGAMSEKRNGRAR